MEILTSLSFIGEKLNAASLVWGVGGSVLLQRHGLEDKPNDIDMFVAMEDVPAADHILAEIGQGKQGKGTDIFATKHFYEYLIKGVHVDVMAGFTLRHGQGLYEYYFDRQSIVSLDMIGGVEIPFTALEDWYVIYKLIPGREAKVKLIEDYLKSNKISHPNLLQTALEGNLPAGIQKNIRRLLG